MESPWSVPHSGSSRFFLHLHLADNNSLPALTSDCFSLACFDILPWAIWSMHISYRVRFPYLGSRTETPRQRRTTLPLPMSKH